MFEKGWNRETQVSASFCLCIIPTAAAAAHANELSGVHKAEFICKLLLLLLLGFCMLHTYIFVAAASKRVHSQISG